MAMGMMAPAQQKQMLQAMGTIQLTGDGLLWITGRDPRPALSLITAQNL
jgi:hypothetical protein